MDESSFEEQETTNHIAHEEEILHEEIKPKNVLQDILKKKSVPFQSNMVQEEGSKISESQNKNSGNSTEEKDDEQTLEDNLNEEQVDEPLQKEIVSKKVVESEVEVKEDELINDSEEKNIDIEKKENVAESEPKETKIVPQNSDKSDSVQSTQSDGEPLDTTTKEFVPEIRTFTFSSLISRKLEL